MHGGSASMMVAGRGHITVSPAQAITWGGNMRVRQAVIKEPFKCEVREVDLPAPAANQVLVETEVSAVSAGTELAIWTGTHQWLKDPNLPDWNFPFRAGDSAAGTIVEFG